MNGIGRLRSYGHPILDAFSFKFMRFGTRIVPTQILNAERFRAPVLFRNHKPETGLAFLTDTAELDD